MEEEHLQGGQQVDVDTRELQSITSDLHITDLHYSGSFMTWCNMREGDARIYWMQAMSSSYAVFQSYGSSDHVLAVVCLDDEVEFKPRPFKFCNMWVKHQQFLPCVAHALGKRFNGCPMYVFMRKQKEVKAMLR